MNSLLMVEVGTGNFLGDTLEFSNISSFEFSKDGSYIVVGERDGSVSTLATNISIADNI